MKFYIWLVYNLIRDIVPYTQRVIFNEKMTPIPKSEFDQPLFDWYVQMKPWLAERLKDLRAAKNYKEKTRKGLAIIQMEAVLREVEALVKEPRFFPSGGEMGLFVHNLDLYNKLNRLGNKFGAIDTKKDDHFLTARRQYGNAMALLRFMTTDKVHIQDNGEILCIARVPGIQRDDSVPTVPFEGLDNHTIGKVAIYNRPESQDDYCVACRCEAAPHG